MTEDEMLNEKETAIKDEMMVEEIRSEEIPKEIVLGTGSRQEAGENDAIKVPMRIKDDYQVATPDSWISTALDKGLPIETLERLFAMKKEYDAQQARKAFDEAMMVFQSRCPIIKKTKAGGVTKEGITAYRYAPIEAVVEQVKDLVAECGFSYLIKTPIIAEGIVKVSVEIRHIMGHSETSTMEMPLLTKTGVMSDAQVIAGTNTFAKRYAFLNALGIMTADEDNDGILPYQTEEFTELTKNWQYKDNYINQIEGSLSSGKAYNQFVATLPTAQQTSKFIKLLEKIKPEKHKELWLLFQKFTNQNVDTFLTNLSSKINKE